MSYDLYLLIDTGGEHLTCVVELGNYTSNVGGMWAEALGYRLGDLDGRNAADVIPDVTRAVKCMEADPAKYEAMNPDNGWGSYSGALAYLRSLLEGCIEHPKTQISVSH